MYSSPRHSPECMIWVSMQNLWRYIQNNRYGQRLCLEAWHINMSNHALNRDDGAYLPEEYMHLIGR
jgi:hypothetical protein